MKPVSVLQLSLLMSCLIAAVAGPAQGQESPTTPVAAEYRLGPDDVLQIQVWGRTDLSGRAVVDPSGKLQLPLVGQVDAAGRTPAELSQQLSGRYQILDSRIPDVSVAVVEYNSRSVNVLGEARTPGKYGFPHIPDILAVILAAGGVTPEADLGRVQVVRHEHREGEPRTITVDLSGGLEEGPTDGLPQIRPRDTIIIPSRAGEFAPGNQFQILGAVRTPGAYPLSATATVLEAISASGGATPDADLSKVHLTRSTESGALSYELNLEGYLHEAQPDADLAVVSGDIVTVPSRRSTLGTIFDVLLKVTPVISVAIGLGYAFR
jgi:polysaccharide biosynthesis/export protein